MSKTPAQRLISLILCIAAIASIALGIFGVTQRSGADADARLTAMRTRAVLAATGEGAVESYVTAAKKKAAADAKAAGKGMADTRAAIEKAEAEARANNTATLIDYAAIDVQPLNAALAAMSATMADLSAETERAEAEFIKSRGAKAVAEPTAAPTELPAEAQEVPAAESDSAGGLDDLPLVLTEEPTVDLTGFQATAEMTRLQGVVDEQYAAVGKALQGVYPALDEGTLAQFKPMMLSLTHARNDHYETEYDRYAKAGGSAALQGGETAAALLARYGDDLVTIGLALLLVALICFFYAIISRKVTLPLIIIGGFFLLLCVLSIVLDLSITALLSNAIVRMGMNSVMVLAMVPAIQCGIALNLGLPIGIIGGLIGGLLCIEYGYSGWWGFLYANLIGLLISAVLGYLYGLLLNMLKGSEMAVTTYVGFSIVALMCIAWIVLPFKSLVLKWPLGNGLRTTISLEPAFQHLLDNFLAFRIGGITVPTGLLLFMALACFVMWMFTRTKTGIAMQAAGNNPRFAEATGINVDKMRIIGTVLSTMLGAVGIIVYSQSYGFMQLYTAPRTLGLVAASAILIGGATTSRARISHVLIGTFLFQGVLTLGMPVANALIPGSTIAETIRILVSNGIILYALTKSGGASRA